MVNRRAATGAGLVWVEEIGIVAEGGPSGLWLRSGGPGEVSAEVNPFAAPGDSRFTLLLGAPGGQLPGVGSVVEVIRSLEPAVRDRLMVTVYGAEPDGRLSLGQQLADALGGPVRVHHGVLTTASGGTAHRTAVDAAGNPSWQPFAELSTYLPGRVGVQVDRWLAPFPEARIVSPARYQLTPEWIVDVVPAGLVVRPAAAAPNPLLRCAPTHPDRVDLVVDAPGGRVLPDDMLTALGRLGDAMPFAARSRLRLVLTADVAPSSERSLQWAVPAPQVGWSRPIGVTPASLQLREPSAGSSPATSPPATSPPATDSSSVGWAPLTKFVVDEAFVDELSVR